MSPESSVDDLRVSSTSMSSRSRTTYRNASRNDHPTPAAKTPPKTSAVRHIASGRTTVQKKKYDASSDLSVVQRAAASASAASRVAVVMRAMCGDDLFYTARRASDAGESSDTECPYAGIARER
mmetsp:Transcript_6924/g.27869  ORF Transcript_6924/g.27869 Transcript_6924/m.27869 type:complete len:124 (+) Transcript_6924:1435-1806(+)